MSIVTEEFNMSDLDNFSRKLDSIKFNYSYEQKLAKFAEAILTIFGGALGGLPGAAVPVTVEQLTGGLSGYYSTVEATLTRSIDVISGYKDFLNRHPNYDLIRVEITYQLEVIRDTMYFIPVDIHCTGLHSMNPPGWFTPAN